MRNRLTHLTLFTTLLVWTACGGSEDPIAEDSDAIESGGAPFRLKSVRSGRCIQGGAGPTAQVLCAQAQALVSDQGRLRVSGLCFFGSFFLDCNAGATPLRWAFDNVGSGGKLLEIGRTGRCLTEVEGRTATVVACDANDPGQRWRKIAP